MKKCATPGCNARVMTNLNCEHHRPRDTRKPPLQTEERARKSELDRQRRARRRAAVGLLAGWENSYG
jgi:hypothetical protein